MLVLRVMRWLAVRMATMVALGAIPTLMTLAGCSMPDQAAAGIGVLYLLIRLWREPVRGVRRGTTADATESNASGI